MSGISKLWKKPGKEKQRDRAAAELAAIRSEDYTGIDPASHKGTNKPRRATTNQRPGGIRLGGVRSLMGTNK